MVSLLEDENCIKQQVYSKMINDLNMALELSVSSDTPIISTTVYASLSADKRLSGIRPYNYLGKLDVLHRNIENDIPMEDWVMRGIYRYFYSFLLNVSKGAITEAEQKAARLRIARKMQAVVNCITALKYMPTEYILFDLMLLPYAEALAIVGSRDCLCLLLSIACNCLYIFEVTNQNAVLYNQVFQAYMQVKETDSITYVLNTTELLLMCRKV